MLSVFNENGQVDFQICMKLHLCPQLDYVLINFLKFVGVATDLILSGNSLQVCIQGS